MAQCLQSIQLSFGVLVLLLADRFDPSASLLGIGKGEWICERLAEVRSRYQCETGCAQFRRYHRAVSDNGYNYVLTT